MRRAHLARALPALVLVGATACATYQPRPGPRISEMNGDYYRDGQKFTIGTLGGGAEELVAGDPNALEYARRARSLSRRATALYGLGLLTMVASPLTLNASPREARAPVFWSVLGVGAGLAYLGIYWSIEGRAVLIDAVNVYNDDLEAARQPSPPAAALGGPP